jgi:hypothetical protein
MTITYPGQPTQEDANQQPINIEKMKVLTEMFKEPAELMQLNALEINEVHEDAKPMHLPWIVGPNDTSVIYDNNGDIVCDYNDEYQAELIVQAVNRAPAFDAILSALETLYIKDNHSDLSTQDLQYEAAAGSERAAATLKARLALKIAKGEA